MNKYIKHIVEAFDFGSVKQQNVHDRINDNIHKMYMNTINGVLNKTITSSKDIEPYIKEMFNNAVAIYKPKDNEEFKKLIKRWTRFFGNKCSLNWIDVSNITDMSDIFDKSKFNGDISKWDVSNVTDMNGMFTYSKFNGDISNWDVSNVTNMSIMFAQSEFNGDISNWDVSNVIDMHGMFYESKFNRDISYWDVNNVTDMGGMFAHSDFNRDISQWDVSNVTDMHCMFFDSKFNGDISQWNVNIIDYEDIFIGCPIKDEYKPHFK